MNFTVRDLKDLKLNENDLEHDLEDPTRSVQPESHTAAVYSIHIAVILNKQKIIEKVLPSTQDLEKNPKLWRRLITWHNMASPLYLSIVSKNKSIFCYILQNCTHLLHHRGLHHNTVLGTASASNSVDFLQLAFAGCDKKTEMIGHLELPYMYDLGNCLSCAVESRALDSLKLLIAKGASKYLAFNKYLELSEKLIKADDMETFAIFIDDKDAQNMSDVLIQIIEYDRPRLATVLLETIARLESIKRPSPVLKCSNGKQKKSIGFLNEQIPFLIYSMITNAENVARVLIADDKKYLSKYGQYKQYSASDWTVILGKNDLELCIKQRYGNTSPNTNESVQNESPIVAALKLNFRPMICVRKLIDQGFNLNDVTSENETAFSVSVKQQTIGRTPEVRNQLVRFLLKNGADPFKGCMAMESFPCRGNDPFSTVIMKSYLNFRIIPEILYAGADISRSTLVNALVQNFKNPAASKMLVLILKTGCKITQQQKNLLTQLQFKKGLDEELAEQIHLFLNEFPNLFSVCRNSIRSFCGTNLQFFISNSELPHKIKNALLFSDVFEQYTLYP
ncbi:hypothetical protein KUTeg_010830 [Tegillarca granosa]|uniref:Ankyrin repeat protein n=1 Tax=Tegillarca granosa TaxID=220873 RepID=A0ABQ9F7C7_TEGGR|nr:hypothetical protein KUTeg_010830 [Tegillarca granosa]